MTVAIGSCPEARIDDIARGEVPCQQEAKSRHEGMDHVFCPERGRDHQRDGVARLVRGYARNGLSVPARDFRSFHDGTRSSRRLFTLRALADGRPHISTRDRHHRIRSRSELGRHRTIGRCRRHQDVPQFLSRAGYSRSAQGAGGGSRSRSRIVGTFDDACSSAPPDRTFLQANRDFGAFSP